MVSRRSCLSALPVGLASLAWLGDSRTRRPAVLVPAAATMPGPAAGAVPDPAAAAAGAAAVRSFTVDLYRDLARTAPALGNLVCSPYSAIVALAMARAGARGRTAQEMDTVLHGPAPRPQGLDAGLNALEQMLRAAYQTSDGTADQLPRLATANSLWTQADLVLEAAFLRVLSSSYGATEHPVDFRTATEAARQAINAWVSQRTVGKIPELLKPGMVTADTSLVLTNAIHLKAGWRYPFPESLTRLAPFRLDSGQSVAVPMMASTANAIGYANGDGWQAVSLPYLDRASSGVGTRTPASGMAMAVVVPKPGGLAALERGLDEAWLRRLFAGFVPTSTRVCLPRWTFRLPVELGDLLIGLGMPTAFSPAADFTGMCAAGGLRISRVVHEAFIAVDEFGTEAAAATAVVIERAGAAVEVVADRPFLYVIYDVATATPLFIGRVTDPSTGGAAVLDRG